MGSGDAFLVVRLQIAITDILHNGARKKIGILKHNPQTAPEIRFFYLVYIDIVIADFTVRNIVETIYQIGNSGLARAGRSYKSHLLPGLGVKGDVMQHGLARLIFKIHVIKAHVAAQAGISYRTVVMGMLPCPDVGALGAFFKRAVLLLARVY